MDEARILSRLALRKLPDPLSGDHPLTSGQPLMCAPLPFDWFLVISNDVCWVDEHRVVERIGRAAETIVTCQYADVASTYAASCYRSASPSWIFEYSAEREPGGMREFGTPPNLYYELKSQRMSDTEIDFEAPFPLAYLITDLMEEICGYNHEMARPNMTSWPVEPYERPSLLKWWIGLP